FYHRPSPHLYLYSFPTRRSSDLISTKIFPLLIPASTPQGPSAIDCRADAFVTMAKITSAADATSRGESAHFMPFSISHCAFPRVDRKSTRLNSSHVSISYAVFCL